mgnify:FL=1
MEAAFLVAIIITIASFMLVGGVMARFLSNTDDTTAENICRDSVALRAKSTIDINGKFIDKEITPVPVMCRTIDKKVSGDREAIKEMVAQKIARCWWMFGQGKYEEILGSNFGSISGFFSFSNYKNKCFNCYNILIDNKDFTPIAGWEMQDYMSTHNMTGTNLSYLNYVQSSGGPGRIVFNAPTIMPGEAYGISYMPINKKDSTFWGGVGKMGIAGAIVIGVGLVGVCIISGPFCVGLVTTQVGLAVVSSSATTIAAGSIALGGATVYLSKSGYNDAMKAVFSERDVSSIYISFSKTAQENCGAGDIAGQ